MYVFIIKKLFHHFDLENMWLRYFFPVNPRINGATNVQNYSLYLKAKDVIRNYRTGLQNIILMTKF